MLLGLLALLLLLGGISWAMYGAGNSGGEVEVPDVVGLEEQAARQRLTDAGLRVEISKRESSAGEEGKVLEQSVAAGESVEQGSRVGLTVGEGSKVEVPDIPYGATEDEARAELEALGLELGSTGQTPSDQIPAGGVVAQDPLPGVEVEPGAAVNITLSSGPAPAPEPTVAAPQQSPTQQPSNGQGPSGNQGGGNAPSADEIQEQVQDQLEDQREDAGD